ncbi:MAG: PEP-CTERM sorting domain-containing protein [Planctomycetaceae bacterium]|nr:PEP-CTERM sorting domain-containing protein [Planctomycetaceae bacterium]
MKTRYLLFSIVLLVSFSTPALATVMYGALSNFDAINDTGVTTHGFEIELEGCAASDVSYTFGSPYNRYGDPIVISTGTGVIVRYASSYDNVTQTWSAGTDTGTLPDTGGHSLFNGSYPGYPGTVPGDHFGISLNVNPTNTIYRWLVDGGNGTLTPFGTNVKIPAPVLTLVPPANPGLPQVVQAVLPAPANENDPDHPLFGEAIWAKVTIITVQNPEPVRLEDLVLGNPAVPETETEIEWQLLQAGNAGFDARGDDVIVGDGNESVTRRYEFYKYLGDLSDRSLYDEYGEALIEDPTTEAAKLLNNGMGVVGDFLGSQNVALNILVPEPATMSLLALGGLAALIRRRK